MGVQVQRHPCQVSCFDRFGHIFAADTGMGIGWRSEQTTTWKQISPQEKFYGFGERVGMLNHRGKRFTHWTTDCVDYNALTDEMYQAIPFFMSVSPEINYGVFFNTTHWSQFDVGAEQADVLQMTTHSRELDYYIIYGEEPGDIIESYTQLTGRIDLPPLWSLGYHQCRWSYDSETKVRQLVKEFRDRHIPCDVIHLDIDYMQGYRVFTWNNRQFPNPQQLIKDLNRVGFQVVNIIDPGVKYELDTDYHVCDRGLEQDYFVRHPDGKLFHGYVWPDRAVFPDFLRTDVRQWWGNLHRSLTDIGIAGIWNDMNEPALDDRPFCDEGDKITFPLNTLQGDTEERVTHAETHNLYGMMMTKACREALETLRSQRSFVLTRSGYAGIQKWSAVWTGDNQSLWEYLEISLPMLCNLGLSGVPFVGADIGGFAGNATPELFARWMQIGVFYPLMRSHSMIHTKPHEPWSFGEEVEKICREYIELRYRLLPYLYSLFWSAANTGSPILRPLFYHYPQDSQTYELYDQVLLGSSLMAAPVYRPGVESRSVYLPAGTWYDWWTGESRTGEKYILAHAPLEKMPIYIREGSIIPLAPVMQYVGELAVDELRLLVAPGTGEFTLYEDDGTSFDYRQELYVTTTYRVYQQGAEVVVEVIPRQGEWVPNPRKVIVAVIGKGEQEFVDEGMGKTLVF
ncbi:Alpha-glucosidase [Richelia intracellularis]|nr:Alpha-glucosidase [Richelia intracellularis]